MTVARRVSWVVGRGGRPGTGRKSSREETVNKCRHASILLTIKHMHGNDDIVSRHAYLSGEEEGEVSLLCIVVVEISVKFTREYPDKPNGWLVLARSFSLPGASSESWKPARRAKTPGRRPPPSTPHRRLETPPRRKSDTNSRPEHKPDNKPSQCPTIERCPVCTHPKPRLPAPYG